MAIDQALNNIKNIGESLVESTVSSILSGPTGLLSSLNQQFRQPVIQFGDKRGFFIPGTEQMVRGFERQQFVDVDTGDVFFFNPNDPPVDVVGKESFLNDVKQLQAGENPSGFEESLVSLVRQFDNPEDAISEVKKRGIKVFKQLSR